MHKGNDTLKEGEEVIFRGFDAFNLKKVNEKKTRNMYEDIEIVVTEHYTPSFKPIKVFDMSVYEG